MKSYDTLDSGSSDLSTPGDASLSTAFRAHTCLTELSILTNPPGTAANVTLFTTIAQATALKKLRLFFTSYSGDLQPGVPLPLCPQITELTLMNVRMKPDGNGVDSFVKSFPNLDSLGIDAEIYNDGHLDTLLRMLKKQSRVLTELGLRYTQSPSRQAHFAASSWSILVSANLPRLRLLSIGAGVLPDIENLCQRWSQGHHPALQTLVYTSQLQIPPEFASALCDLEIFPYLRTGSIFSGVCVRTPGCKESRAETCAQVCRMTDIDVEYSCLACEKTLGGFTLPSIAPAAPVLPRINFG